MALPPAIDIHVHVDPESLFTLTGDCGASLGGDARRFLGLA